MRLEKLAESKLKELGNLAGALASRLGELGKLALNSRLGKLAESRLKELGRLAASGLVELLAGASRLLE